MPKVEELNRAKYFSILDLRAGYHHIGLTTDLIPKTAFTSPFGEYEYIKVPFGLAQALVYFQELMTGSSERPTICNGLSGQHHHIQLHPRRTPKTHQDSIRETLPRQTINEIE